MFLEVEQNLNPCWVEVNICIKTIELEISKSFMDPLL